MPAARPDWAVDPEDPRAPPHEVWEALTPEQRSRVIASLPSSLPPEMVGGIPEGDDHSEPINDARDTLRGHFGRSSRDAYVGSVLAVYYPGERLLAPDLFVVLGAGSHRRQTWMVQAEGKGLDLVIEVLVKGDSAKDLKENVARYARLGIPESFVCEPRHERLRGFHLPPEGGRYERIMPQAGRLPCRVLGLDLLVMEGRLRFLLDEAVLPNTTDLNRRLNKLLAEVTERAEAEAQRAEAEAQRAEAEAQQRALAEQRLAEALARLKRYEPDDPAD